MHRSHIHIPYVIFGPLFNMEKSIYESHENQVTSDVKKCVKTIQDTQTESLLFLRFIIEFCLLLFCCSHFTDYFIYEFFFATPPIPLHLRYFQRLPVLLYLSLSRPFISLSLSLSYFIPLAIIIVFTSSSGLLPGSSSFCSLFIISDRHFFRSILYTIFP